MKRWLRTIIFAVSILCMLLASGCSAKSMEKAKGVSYDNIVCQYSYRRSEYCYKDFSTNITVYADNTLKVCTVPYDTEYTDPEIFDSETYTITEKQKQELIDLIRSKKIIKMDELTPAYITDAASEHRYIRLYDENGNQVHECGGKNPYNKDFFDAELYIHNLVPEGVIEELRDQTAIKMAMSKHGISFDEIICQIAFRTEYENDGQAATVVTFYPDGTYDLAAGSIDNPNKTGKSKSKKYSIQDIQLNTIRGRISEYIVINSYNIERYGPENSRDIEEAEMYIKLFDENGESVYWSALTQWNQMQEKDWGYDEVGGYLRTMTKTERKKFEENLIENNFGISFDNTVVKLIDYSEDRPCINGSYVWIEYTVYADGTLKLEAVDYYKTWEYETILTRTFDIGTYRAGVIRDKMKKDSISYLFTELDDDYEGTYMSLLMFYDEKGEERLYYPIPGELYDVQYEMINVIKDSITDEEREAFLAELKAMAD